MSVTTPRAVFITTVVVIPALIGACVSSTAPATVVADEPVLRQTLQRLEAVRDEIDRLPVPAGTTSGTARLDECSEDSGDIFQPGIERKWVVDAGTGAEAGATIVEALHKAGWTVTADRRTTELEHYSLSMQRDGWTAVGGVSAYDDDLGPAVFVVVKVKDAKPCHR